MYPEAYWLRTGTNTVVVAGHVMLCIKYYAMNYFVSYQCDPHKIIKYLQYGQNVCLCVCKGEGGGGSQETDSVGWKKISNLRTGLRDVTG